MQSRIKQLTTLKIAPLQFTQIVRSTYLTSVFNMP